MSKDEHTVICCGTLEKMLICWMKTPLEVRVLPFIVGNDGNKYRVNYCPSCGAYIREAELLK